MGSGVFCEECGQELRTGDWPWCHRYGYHPRTTRRPIVVNERERTVLYRHPVTGEVKYPGRNDTPMPEQYARQGFQRVDFPTLHSLEQFERSQPGVRSEKAWYDEGTGRGFDDDDPPTLQEELAELGVPEGSITFRNHDPDRKND